MKPARPQYQNSVDLGARLTVNEAVFRAMVFPAKRS